MNIHDYPPRLIAMTDRSLATADETLRRFEHVARLAQPFTVMFQLRDRALPARERLAFGRELRALCAAERQWFQVNDRCDLAMLLDADGVHLGEASMSAFDARRVLGANAFVSRACHDPERELESGVDAWVLSPIFAERKGRAALGLEAIERLAQRLRAARTARSARTGTYALGAVNASNAASCVARGATGAAVIGAILRSEGVELLLDALAVRRGD